MGGGGGEGGGEWAGGGKRMKGIISLNITLFTECMCCAFVMVFQTALFLTFYMLGSCFRTLAEILVSVLSIFCLRLYGERVLCRSVLTAAHREQR